MPSPYPDEQKATRAELDSIFASAEIVRIIHYSCESFDDRLNGASPRITSIAVRRLDSSQTESFSIHKVAEREGLDLGLSDQDYNRIERIMLDDFFEYVRRGGEATMYLHWNMRDSNFGFAAIEHRYAVLGGEPIKIPESKRFDLSPALQRLYGSGYIDHPRLPKLCEKNNITMLRFLSGRDEADAFARGEYVSLHQSTLRKVDILHTIADLAYRGSLKTNASWWIIHGGSIRSVWLWIAANQTIVFILAFVGVALTIWFAYHLT
jgi:hypothetical protein